MHGNLSMSSKDPHFFWSAGQDLSLKLLRQSHPCRVISGPLTHSMVLPSRFKRCSEAELEGYLSILVEQSDFVRSEGSFYSHISNALRPERHKWKHMHLSAQHTSIHMNVT